MNEKVEEENLLSREVFVFSPSRGITMNLDPQSLPGHDDAANRFELIGNNPLIKNNKTSNLSEYDLYIEDPSNTEIKNELINDISFTAGKCYLKKNAIDILYCGFDIFANDSKFSVNNSQTLNFYINILLTYPPELKHTSLMQYFATLHKIIENRDITLDYKYLVTNRALEIEWEKCNFIKYTHFKAFFASMKRFFKISPLFTEEPFIDENTTSIFQDLLRRTLAGRALSILQCIIDCDDQLKLLMLFKCIEWLQKLENLKMLINLNLSVLMSKGKDKVAVDLLKQMYGRSTMAFNMQGAEPSISPIPVERFDERPHPKPATIIAKLGSSSDQTSQHQPHIEKIPEIRTEPSIDTPSKTKVQIGRLSEPENHAPIGRAKASESNSSRRTQRESIREDTASETPVVSNKMSGQVRNKNKMNVFFDLYNATKYQEDYSGRINNFLKKASRLGYEYSSPDKEKIDAIVTKFKSSYTPEQLIDLLKNYKKFCADYQILVSPHVIQNLDTTKTAQSTPLNKPKAEPERSKSPPHNNMGALKMLKTSSEKFASALQSNLGANLASAQVRESQNRVLPSHNEDIHETNRLSVKKEIERKSREKEQEEIKSSSTHIQETKDLNKVKVERKKPEWTTFKVFAPGAGESRGFNDASRSGRNYDE